MLSQTEQLTTINSIFNKYVRFGYNYILSPNCKKTIGFRKKDFELITDIQYGNTVSQFKLLPKILFKDLYKQIENFQTNSDKQIIFNCFTDNLYGIWLYAIFSNSFTERYFDRLKYTTTIINAANIDDFINDFIQKTEEISREELTNGPEFLVTKNGKTFRYIQKPDARYRNLYIYKHQFEDLEKMRLLIKNNETEKTEAQITKKDIETALHIIVNKDNTFKNYKLNNRCRKTYGMKKADFNDFMVNKFGDIPSELLKMPKILYKDFYNNLNNFDRTEDKNTIYNMFTDKLHSIWIYLYFTPRLVIEEKTKLKYSDWLINEENVEDFIDYYLNMSKNISNNEDVIEKEGYCLNKKQIDELKEIKRYILKQ